MRGASASQQFVHGLVFAFAISTRFAIADEPPISLTQYKVKSINRERRIAIFDANGQAGHALDDEIGVVAGGSFRVGRVFVHDENHFGVKIAPDQPMPAVGNEAVRVPRDAGAHMRSWLPAGCTLSARIDSKSPSGATAWLDCGSLDGFRIGDRMLVLRNEIPIGRATIAEVRDKAGIASVVPLVSNAACAVNDRVCLWPGPSDLDGGRLETKVLFVRPMTGSDRIEVGFPAEARDGAAVGQHWEVSRAGEYVDSVELVATRGRFAIGLQSIAFARSPVQVGDTIRLRPADQVKLGRMPLRVFRREGDYCLMNGGEDVGLEIGGKLAVVRDGRLIAELEIDTVKMDYCGATRTRSVSGGGLFAASRPVGGTDIRDWDAVVPLEFAANVQEPPPLGRVEQIFPEEKWLIARPGRIGATASAGQLVRIGQAPSSVGLVVCVTDGAWLVHVPRSCNRGNIAVGAMVMRP